MTEKELSTLILGFRMTLSKIYREQPYNDEGKRCDPSTIFEIITEYDKYFDIKKAIKGRTTDTEEENDE